MDMTMRRLDRWLAADNETPLFVLAVKAYKPLSNGISPSSHPLMAIVLFAELAGQ